MYFAIALVLAPWLTVSAIVVLGGVSFVFRYVLESGYDIGSRVADANENIQQAAQAGTQGIRDTKLFSLKKSCLVISCKPSISLRAQASSNAETKRRLIIFTIF